MDSADRTLTIDGSTTELPRQVEIGRAPAPLQFRDRARYEILGELGRGGRGRVLRARDRELGRQVAIKELLPCDVRAEARFFREVMITARLDHPGIVPVYEAGRWSDGTPFYTMPLVAGSSLRARIAAAPDRRALLPHAVRVVEAMAYAHARGIIHRDLKPSNILIGAHDETVVIDWGLGKELPERPAPSDLELTATGAILGTPRYMSPEQARGEASDARTDVHALGRLLSELGGDDGRFAPVLRRALDQDRNRRYRDAGVLLAALHHCGPA
jgi:serine/threonine protein kinase